MGFLSFMHLFFHHLHPPTYDMRGAKRVKQTNTQRMLLVKDELMSIFMKIVICGDSLQCWLT